MLANYLPAPLEAEVEVGPGLRKKMRGSEEQNPKP